MYDDLLVWVVQVNLKGCLHLEKVVHPLRWDWSVAPLLRCLHDRRAHSRQFPSSIQDSSSFGAFIWFLRGIYRLIQTPWRMPQCLLSTKVQPFVAVVYQLSTLPTALNSPPVLGECRGLPECLFVVCFMLLIVATPRCFAQHWNYFCNSSTEHFSICWFGRTAPSVRFAVFREGAVCVRRNPLHHKLPV